MIQRKQSLFLFIAIILNFICLIFPIGIFIPKGVGVNSIMYNLWIQDGAGTVSFSSAPLFVSLLANILVSLVTIFLYKNRRLQIKLCSWNLFILIVWYLAYVIMCLLFKGQYDGFELKYPVVFPMISLILTSMARSAIRKDEALVRAADRIR